MAEWELVEIERITWNDGASAGSRPFCLRECPECAALVQDDPVKMEKHRKDHILGPIMGGNALI